ncbi:HIT family protein [Desulfurococcus amylolyticus]|uniref:Probable bis(5'-adenosyl)-triphosphatase, HIT family n=1 Tax=Desulfurococcus amylolyticus (strain DSM 18924 / JCM 16383 / VKM B-2413 / 1221n) TaxID=490899 RepID=B8D615_DESA1|nr:HIT domain-containing protein [Desulfurococcus amylolyticus]ACL11546.1 Probable bis(5'-adenosyl)-triphosphatase, HIT family [Desulfurococcus amylolyticus 1221n]
MRILWNPWRYEYIKRFNSGEKEIGECLFCRLKSMNDNEALIIYRGVYSFIVLNAYPYNSGHVMIAPYDHIGSLEDLQDEALLEMVKLVKLSMKIIRKAFNPDGFNIGVNIGRVAGAGVPGHVHIHVVPRWVGDTNFMGVIAGVKTLPISLQETYSILRKTLNEIQGA